MAERRKIIWEFIAKTKDLQQGLKEVRSGMKDADTSAGGLLGNLKGMAPALGAAGAAAAAGAFAQFSFDAALSAEAADRVRRSVEELVPRYGSLRDELNEVRTSSGLSKREFDEMILPLAQLATNSGLARDEMGGFIDQLVTKAGDIAAFRGDLDLTDDVLQSFFSGLKGEFDSLEQWGFRIKQSTVDQEALRLAGKDTTDELTDQERMIGFLNLAMTQNVDATGAMEDAQGSLQDTLNDTEAAAEDAKDWWGGVVNDVLVGGRDIALTLQDVVQWGTNTEQMAEDMAAGFERMGEKAEKTDEKLSVFAQSGLLEVTDEMWNLEDAALSVRDAFEEQIDAARRIRDPLARYAELMGLSADAAFRLAQQAGIVSPRDIARSPLGPGATEFPTGQLHGGGRVPGPSGQPRLIRALGGEIVTPENAGGMGGPTVIVNMGVVGDPDAAANAVADLLTRYERVNGARPSGLVES